MLSTLFVTNAYDISYDINKCIISIYSLEKGTSWNALASWDSSR